MKLFQRIDFFGETEHAFIDLTYIFLHLVREYGIADHLGKPFFGQENFDEIYRQNALALSAAEENGLSDFVALAADAVDSWLTHIVQTPTHKNTALVVRNQA